MAMSLHVSARSSYRGVHIHLRSDTVRKAKTMFMFRRFDRPPYPLAIDQQRSTLHRNFRTHKDIDNFRPCRRVCYDLMMSDLASWFDHPDVFEECRKLFSRSCNKAIAQSREFSREIYRGTVFRIDIYFYSSSPADESIWTSPAWLENEDDEVACSGEDRCVICLKKFESKRGDWTRLSSCTHVFHHLCHDRTFMPIM